MYSIITLQYRFPFIDSSSIVSSTTIAGKIKNNGFSKDTAITIDDSSDDEVIVIDSSDDESIQNTPRSMRKENLHSQIVSSSAKMPSRVPRSSDDWRHSPTKFSALPLRTVSPASNAKNHQYGTKYKKKV